MRIGKHFRNVGRVRVALALMGLAHMPPVAVSVGLRGTRRVVQTLCDLGLVGCDPRRGRLVTGQQLPESLPELIAAHGRQRAQGEAVPTATCGEYFSGLPKPIT